MSVIDSLRESLSNARAQLAAARQQADTYRATADKIGGVYEELAEKKKNMETRKRELEDFEDETYDSWKGTLWKEDYKNEVEKVVTSYDTVIDNIDTNLDRLNLEKTRYENLANACYGLAGRLASTVNSLIAQIENCVN